MAGDPRLRNSRRHRQGWHGRPHAGGLQGIWMCLSSRGRRRGTGAGRVCQAGAQCLHDEGIRRAGSDLGTGDRGFPRRGHDRLARQVAAPGNLCRQPGSAGGAALTFGHPLFDYLNSLSSPPIGEALVVAGAELVVADLLPPNNPSMALIAEPAFSPPAPPIPLMSPPPVLAASCKRASLSIFVFGWPMVPSIFRKSGMAT